MLKTFLKNYAGTWSQSGDVEGFQHLLRGGANLFTTDDHEFWNNAPFPSFAVNTYTAGGRRAWWELASGLCDAFQTPAAEGSVRRFTIGAFEILVADTRLGRSGDRTTFLDPAEMDQLVGWIRALKAPSVLVVGQPLFEKTTGWSGHVADWNLPDFEQYAVLCRALLSSPQPLIILTGDVHFGRVARAITPDGLELIEVIASPLSLVTGGGEPAWHEPPPLFPAEALPGVSQIPIVPLTSWRRARNHFVTIELWANGGRLCFRVRTWETRPEPNAPPGPVVYEHALQRRM